jgi:DNA polymerase-1
MSQDEKMMEAFRQGQDIHRSTAAWVYGVGLDEVTDKQRSEAKALNFGVLYGMGPQKFAREAGVSVEEARSFIGRYFDEYAGVNKYMEELVELVREMGYAETLLGRKRYIPEINARAPGVQAQAERAAINFPVQGTAADILKKAMIVLHERMRADFPESLMVLTVHDELVCEVRKDQKQELAGIMKECMEGVISLDVPLVVDVSEGPNWRQMEVVEE